MASLGMIACNNEDDSIINNPVKQNVEIISLENATVSLEDAESIANNFFQPITSSWGLRKEVKEINTINNAGIPLMYIINYKGGGFAIVSATRDYYPILAYSKEYVYKSALSIN